MKVLITGATGLVGREIVKECHNKGISVHYLTTSKSKINDSENYKGFYWNPSQNEIDTACFKGVDVIINLAGASISKRWSTSYKKEILDSRLHSLELLYNTIKNDNIEIDQFISASAIGIYPSSLTNYYDEEFHEVSESFLGEVVFKWEKAIKAMEDLCKTVTTIRIGLVMALDGGAFPEMVKPIRFGAGAAFGSGEQWQSWIHITDLASIFLHCLKNKLHGVFNAVAPNPVTNSELTKAVASVLQKPLILPNIPKFAMKLTLGEMHILLFESQRVSAEKLNNFGFKFEFNNILLAVKDLLQVDITN